MGTKILQNFVSCLKNKALASLIDLFLQILMRKEPNIFLEYETSNISYQNIE